MDNEQCQRYASATAVAVFLIVWMLPLHGQETGVNCDLRFDPGAVDTQSFQLIWCVETASEVASKVKVVGYGDIGESPETNQMLAAKRIDLIMEKLNAGGVPRSIVSAENRGGTHPGRSYSQVEVLFLEYKEN